MKHVEEVRGAGSCHSLAYVTTAALNHDTQEFQVGVHFRSTSQQDPPFDMSWTCISEVITHYLNAWLV